MYPVLRIVAAEVMGIPMTEMGLVAVALVVAAFTWITSFLYKKAKYILDRMSLFQGPVALPFIGNLHQFHFTPEEFFEQAQGLAYMLRKDKDRITRVWFGPMPHVLIYGPEECEAVLGSSKMLNKTMQYSFLSAWIGEGLLISKPDKWRPRRKLLTPTFHYEILKDFVEVYNRHGRTLLGKFLKLADGGEYDDIFHTVTLCTLDVICEAALGICLDVQKNPHSPYLDSVFKMKVIIQKRLVKPQYYPEFLFNLIGAGREQARCVKILHEFTGNVIRARKAKADAAGGVEKLLAQESAEVAHSLLMVNVVGGQREPICKE
ncbi:hypothetical protein TELCIR_05314 [Teladorsagia circumcincta]|uniref:Unspecific monooxygenase n=1 Tax=Teladorsagia circumcincta TaxID=45464 RepID=A0A2G9USR3_TELCI|nr:hypothetical protein TELCIR_05314 [Teladorsagia circumcincta]